MEPLLTDWRKEGKHLPKCLKDFHDQKELFRAMHELTQSPSEDNYTKDINEINGHIYIMDKFLWFMARHGYTLQKSRANIPFEELEKNIECVNKLNRERFAEFILKDKNK